VAIALTVTFPGEPPRDLRTCIETTRHGWWYTAPVPNAQAIAMFFTDPQVYRQEGIAIQDELNAAPLTAKRLETARIGDSRVLRVASSCRRSLFGKGWLAVGDSASSYDPLSGRGIFKALRHASSAVNAVIASLAGNNELMSPYAGAVRGEFDEYVRQRRLYYESERRWAEESFWRARGGAAG
jgi:flavin-dependent dehydrogenase